MASFSRPPARLLVAWVLVFGVGWTVWWPINRYPESGWVQAALGLLAVLVGAVVVALVFVQLFRD